VTTLQQAGWRKVVEENGDLITAIDEPDRDQPYSPFLQACSFQGCRVLSHNYIYCPIHTRPVDTD